MQLHDHVMYNLSSKKVRERIKALGLPPPVKKARKVKKLAKAL
jgi:hypothetical protein